ncbi:porin PorA family protein [Blastococcus goldschmidtiae]|uniref:Porin PorA family protein n=1 Tax=Blastococcus goldschmidtiae TaxID=3075546 RepID=A0ABU2K549_9ACTN|nr:porin PorA family protein [Blastococcus sp. DSM 46792]MDT0275332.1 porin PorA family protein [Blastococcus sp. DSM 46792]
MRARVVGLAGIGLGGLAVVASVTAGSWVPLLPVQLPLDESFGTEALGREVTYLDPVTLAPVTSEDVATSVRVRGDEDTGAAGDRTAVWEYVSETSDADGTLVATSTTLVCLDRWTAEAVDCAGESVDGEPTDIRGLTVRFPADTERRDYDLWDTTARQPFPARFEGVERLDGRQVYRFEQEVPEQVIRSVPVPGRLVGSLEDEVFADVVHSSTRTVFVEPLSGVVVSEEESPVTALRGPDGTSGAVLLSGTSSWSEASVREALARAEDVRDERADLRTGVRWAAAGTGAALLALGALLATRRSPTQPHDAQDEPVRVPVPSA